jgi:hypothetical protein
MAWPTRRFEDVTVDKRQIRERICDADPVAVPGFYIEVRLQIQLRNTS